MSDYKDQILVPVHCEMITSMCVCCYGSSTNTVLVLKDVVLP